MSLMQMSRSGARARFPLLQLPLELVEAVLLRMPVHEYLSMSILSKRMAEFVLRSRNYDVKSFQVLIMSNIVSLQINFFGSDKEMYFKGNEDYWLNWSKSEVIILNPSTTPEKHPFLSAFAHILTVFKGNIRLVITPEAQLEILSDPCFSDLYELSLSRTFGPSSKPAFSPEDLELINRKLKVEHELSVDNVVNDFKLDQMYTVKKLTLRHSTHLSGEDLLKMNFETAVFENHRFSIDTIESFALKWLKQKTTPTLKQMRIDWYSTEPVRFTELITRSWKPYERSKHCFAKDLVAEGLHDCSAGFDFQRPDGLLATIAVIRKTYRPILVFHVWHDRFPTKPEIERLQRKYAHLNEQVVEFNKRYGTGHPGEEALRNPNLTDKQFDKLLHETFTMKVARMNRVMDVHKWKRHYDEHFVPLRRKIASFF